jgi:hypothetical protein
MLSDNTYRLKYTTIDIFNGSVTGEHLRVLDLSYCMSLTSEGLRYIRERCRQLVTLFLTGCIHLHDDEVVELVKCCTKLSRIGLGYCRELTDIVLTTMADCLWIEALYLNRCFKMTDNGICALAAQCSGLQALNVSSCKNLTDISLERLLEGCPKLTHLDVTYCPHLTKPVLMKFSTLRVGMVLRADMNLNPDIHFQEKINETEKSQEKRSRQISKNLELPSIARVTQNQ